MLRKEEEVGQESFVQRNRGERGEKLWEERRNMQKGANCGGKVWEGAFVGRKVREEK